MAAERVRINRAGEQELDAVMRLWLAGNVQAHGFIPEAYWHGHFEEVRKAVSQMCIRDRVKVAGLPFCLLARDGPYGRGGLFCWLFRAQRGISGLPAGKGVSTGAEGKRNAAGNA